MALLQSVQLQDLYAIINTNGMNVVDEAEVDRILVQVDLLVPDSSPELLGAVGLWQFMLYVQGGWYPKRGVPSLAKLHSQTRSACAVKHCHV